MNASILAFHYQPFSEDQSSQFPGPYYHFAHSLLRPPICPSLTTSGDAIFPIHTRKNLDFATLLLDIHDKNLNNIQKNRSDCY